MADTSKDFTIWHPTHEAMGTHNVVLDVPASGGKMEPSAQVAKPMWKEGVGHTKPKRCHQIQEAFPIVRGCLTVVEVMSAHYANRGVLVTAKLNVEVT
ncbi:unnamed protein product [Sphagnum tenellum]